MNRQQVLIIDDDRDIANLFNKMLAMLGFESEVVYSAKDGLSKLSLVVPDLVLLDLRLGLEISGEDILYQIRTNPRFKNTRVIIITGYPSMAEPISDLSDLVLIKPVEIDHLKTLIQRLVETKSKPQSEYFRDPISGLFNEEFFQTRLELAFARAKRRPDFLYAVVALAIDYDSPADMEIPGAIYDSLMQEVGSRLLRHFRPSDTLARFSKYKFAILYEDLKAPKDLQAIFPRLKEEITQPIKIKKTSYRPVLLMGSAVHSHGFQNPLDILEAAERDLTAS